MKKTKCFQLLRSLKQIEFYRFGLFLKSEFFNKNRTISKLYDILKQNYHDFDNPAISKTKIYEALFPGKLYKEKTLKNLNTELLKLLEKFLGYLYWSNKTNQFEADNFFLEKLKSLSRNGNSKIVESIFNSKINQINIELDKKERVDSEYYYKKYKLQKLINQFYITHKDKKNKVDFLAELTYFNKYSTLTKIKQELNVLSVDTKSKKVIKIDLSKILQDLSKHDINEFITYQQKSPNKIDL